MKNEKSKGIRVEFTNDIVAIANNNLNNTCYVLFVTEDSSFNEWIMDFDHSLHVTPNRIWCATYQCINSGKMQLGNNADCDIVSIGDVNVRTLIGVRRVSKLKKN